MKKFFNYCKGFIKSIFGGIIVLLLKLFSMVGGRKPISKEYINLNTKPDDEEEPPIRPPQQRRKA